MTTINLQNKSIDFPDSWGEIKLIQFIQFMKWLNNRPKEFEAEIEEIIYNLKLVKIFSLSDITEDEINSLGINEVAPIIKSFDSFITNIPSPKVEKSIVISGVLYSFKDLDTLSIGEYVSYQQLLGTKEDKLDIVPELLAIICRPATKRFCPERKEDVFDLVPFNAEDIKWRSQILENAPALDLMGAANFFLSGSHVLTNYSTESTIPKSARKARRALGK